MKIICESAAIEKELNVIKDTIEEYRGFLDPDLIIRNEGANLSVEKYGFANPSQPLISLPGELLLPTEKMALYVKNEEFFMDPDKRDITDIQVKMGNTMLELYNLTKKIPSHRQACCWFAFQDAPDLLEKLLKARTPNEYQGKLMAFCKREAFQEDEDKILCSSFLKMRTIGHKQENDNGDSMVVSTDLMPVIDFLNHHSSGSYFGFVKGKDTSAPEREFLTVSDSRPISFTNECYAYYNQMDALDTFVQYGFPDAYAPYVRSIPIEFDIPKTGKIVVHSMLAPIHKGVLPKQASGLRPYIPGIVARSEDVLELTNLLIPTNSMTPQALRRVLRLQITNRVALKRSLNTNEIWDIVLEAEEKIISENIAFYRSLLKEMEEEMRSGAPERARLAKTVCDVANLQLAKLYKYNFDASRFTTSAAEDEQSVSAMAAAE